MAKLEQCNFPEYGPPSFDAGCTYRMLIMAMRICAARLTDGRAVKWFVEDPKNEVLIKRAQDHLTVASALIPPCVENDL